MMSLEELAEVMRLAISPAILISAVGLLLLSMTNRFGRVIDRARLLARERRTADDAHASMIDEQLAILVRRGGLLRAAVLSATLSLLLIAVMILVLFAAAFEKFELAVITIAVLFVAGIGALVASLFFLLRDVTLALHAMDLEIRTDRA